MIVLWGHLKRNMVYHQEQSEMKMVEIREVIRRLERLEKKRIKRNSSRIRQHVKGTTHFEASLANRMLKKTRA